MWPLIKVLGPQFGETVNISEVIGAGKVKSNAQVAKNKYSDPMQKVFPLGVVGEDVKKEDDNETEDILKILEQLVGWTKAVERRLDSIDHVLDGKA